LSRLVALLREMRPDAGLVATAGPPMLAFALLVAGFAAALRRRGVRVAYTRKTFHFGIFSGATVVHHALGLAAVALYGALVCALVTLAVWRGERSGLFAALARPADAPRERLFILVPMLTTALGGVLGNLFFGAFAAVGYLACGWGDAVGEPVGARFGRHRYRVPSLGGVRAERSFEGSAAVLAVGAAACVVALLALGFPPASALRAGLLGGFAGAAVEAVSHHGLDNLTMQLAASAAAWAVLG
jgi:phytol kinase